uniref:Uncharacterized protein n=1 Tax=Timema tahoe TaxID=61484 RepID=A0A7R9NWH1_9NEOP|nr:unnamed protein product [Timema tahoe]
MSVHCGSKLVDSGFESNFEKRVEHRVQEIWRTLQTAHLQDELSNKPKSKYVSILEHDYSNIVSNELKEELKKTCVAINDNKKDNLNSENKKASVVDVCTNIIHSIQEDIQDMRHALETSSGHQLKENLSVSISRLETCCHDLFFVFRVSTLV